MAIDRRAFAVRQRQMPEHLSGLDKLTPGSLRGARFAVLTISDAIIIDAERGEDKYGNKKYEPAVVLRFSEFPNRIYWVNNVGVNILADEYGDEETGWVGKKVPLVVRENVRNKQTRGTQDMLWVANRDDWDNLFAEDEAARTRKSVPPRAAARAAQAATADPNDR